MKGRWFFWIPVFLYIGYQLYMIISQNIDREALIIIFAGYFVSTSIISLIYYNAEINDYSDELNAMQTKNLLVTIIFTPQIWIILGINYIFDKYLTIKIK